jgi:3',5'-nucleoside bisphosphate phosphatase
VRTFFADLHIHTALSPCAEREMTPDAIVDQALRQGLSLIAICDHNSARNVIAVQQCCKPGLAVMAGIEITTKEEVHLLGFFPDAIMAMAAGSDFYLNLPSAGSSSKIPAEQTIYNLAGRPRGNETKLLSADCGLGLYQVIGLIKRHGGLAVAAHVDRPAFGIFGQLGMFPQRAGFDAIEVTPHLATSPWAEQIGRLGLPMITSSDAHFLDDIGKGRTQLTMEEPSFAEFSMALLGLEGRTCGRA